MQRTVWLTDAFFLVFITTTPLYHKKTACTITQRPPCEPRDLALELLEAFSTLLNFYTCLFVEINNDVD